MSNEILQKFLDVNLLDVGDDNTKLSYLEKASEEVSKSLKKQKRSLLRSTLLLMNERLPETDAITTLCEEAIRKQWQTFRSRFKDDTNQLYRATLLQGLANTTASDVNSAAIVYYTGASTLPYQVRGQDEELFRDFLTQLGLKVETEAQQTWGRNVLAPVEETKFDEAFPTDLSIDVKALTEKLRAAAGPSGGTNANGNWPGGNTEWLNHFGRYTAEAIREVTTSSAQKISSQLVSQFRADITNAVNNLASTMSSSSGEINNTKRTDLLYWKETLYSPSQKASYRRMQPELAAFTAAFDLHTQMPIFHPHSMEYFLRETLYAGLKEAAEAEYSIASFCDALSSQPIIFAGTFSGPFDKGIPLLDFIQAVADQKLPSADVEKYVGIPGETKICLDEVSVWLFRDMQTRRLLGGK